MVSCIASAEEEIHVVILCTSDLHGDIWGYSYEDDKETGHTGMARLHTYINQVRKENPIVFLIDGGDAIQGTIMTDAIANKDPDSEHPVITAMNEMEYDSMTLGNHEFNWGITTMKKILSQARFPVLGANVLYSIAYGKVYHTAGAVSEIVKSGKLVFTDLKSFSKCFVVLFQICHRKLPLFTSHSESV